MDILVMLHDVPRVGKGSVIIAVISIMLYCTNDGQHTVLQVSKQVLAERADV